MRGLWDDECGKTMVEKDVETAEPMEENGRGQESNGLAAVFGGGIWKNRKRLFSTRKRTLRLGPLVFLHRHFKNRQINKIENRLVSSHDGLPTCRKTETSRDTPLPDRRYFTIWKRVRIFHRRRGRNALRETFVLSEEHVGAVQVPRLSSHAFVHTTCPSAQRAGRFQTIRPDEHDTCQVLGLAIGQTEQTKDNKFSQRRRTNFGNFFVFFPPRTRPGVYATRNMRRNTFTRPLAHAFEGERRPRVSLSNISPHCYQFLISAFPDVECHLAFLPSTNAQHLNYKTGGGEETWISIFYKLPYIARVLCSNVACCIRMGL